MKKLSYWVLILGYVLGGIALAHAEQPLSEEEVFQATVKQRDSNTLAVHWSIKPGYYLYRDKIQFHSKQARIQSIDLPKGTAKQSKLLGKYPVYQHDATVLVRFVHPLQNTLILAVHYQGCAEAGFCYPPLTKVFTLQFSKDATPRLTEDAIQKNAVQTKQSKQMTESEQSKAMQLLVNHSIGLMLLGFFGFGLLLSLTPCVLPLIPVLSAIILGQKQLTTTKAFFLSLTYVLAMALTYALAGVFAGLAGSYLQAFLQNPWIIVFVSLVFVLLALSLFGFYELRLPTHWQEKLTHLTNRQRGGSYVSVAFMGCLSTLVISPCITAPLVGVLTYIGNTGNAVLGGFALFVLGLGSGVPLLIIGTSAGKWLPKSGPWMNGVKIILGIMMLVMAVWLLLRILPSDSRIFYLFKPHSVQAQQNRRTPAFTAIKGVSSLNQALIKAQQAGKPVLLDFYANWCISCKEMEKEILSKPRITYLLSSFVVLRADVTANDTEDKALEKKFDVIAPPTFLFFTSDGQEFRTARIVGQVSEEEFANHLNRVLLSK